MLAGLRSLLEPEFQLAKHEMHQELGKLAKTSVQLSVVLIVSRLRLWPFCTFHTLKEDAQWISVQVRSRKT
jgi:hypothetical protein